MRYKGQRQGCIQGDGRGRCWCMLVYAPLPPQEFEEPPPRGKWEIGKKILIPPPLLPKLFSVYWTKDKRLIKIM